MTLKKIFIACLLLSITSVSVFSQTDAKQKGLDAITMESAKSQLEFLASNWTEGRATATKGEFIAGDYLASMLQFNGVKPAGDKDRTRPSRAQRQNGIRSKEFTSYFQKIYFTRELESSSALSLILPKTNQIYSFNEKVDFSIYGSMTSIKLKSDLVFVGYGFTDKESGYDDYKGLDIKNKIIVRVDGYPGHKDTNSLGYKKFHKEERYFEWYLRRKKDEIAEEKGAAGVITIYKGDVSRYWIEKQDFQKMYSNETPRSPLYDKNLDLPSDEIKNDLIEITASKKIINKIFENQDIDVEKFEKALENNFKPQSKVLKNIKLDLEYNVKTDLVLGRNVLGVIEGEIKDEIVVIGGHYDHLGYKDNVMWNGADDNASGTIGVWMLAKAFAASGVKPKRTIVFAAWTGEEIGLFGSKYFVDNPYGEELENIKFYLNFDMISKDDETDTLKNKARMVYTSSLEELKENSIKYIEDYDLNLDITFKPSPKPRGGSDHSSFSAKDIPVMYYMAGFPNTYHTPKDKTFDINWEKMLDVIKISYLNIWDVVNK